MSKIIERCAGIDVGKRFLLCSVLTGAAQEGPASQTRRFDTNVSDLEEMREWVPAGGGHARSDGEYRFLLDSRVQCLGRTLHHCVSESGRGEEP